MKKITITGEKGGTGKSTITALLTEYLNWKGKKVQVIDTDSLRSTQNWLIRCQEQGRVLSGDSSADYQLVDTAGSSGASLPYLRQADLIVVPFRAHYVDLEAVSEWFFATNSKIQQKVVFVPNHWQNTKEQREGIKELAQVIKQEQAGQILTALTNRPALYGTIHNGSKDNFFQQKNLPPEIIKLMEEIVNKLAAS